MREKILGFIAFLFIRLLGLTYRYELFFSNKRDQEKFYQFYHYKTSNYLLAFFHQDELCFANYFANKDVYALISLSKDGQIMANATSHMGIRSVRGSSSKRAIAGLIAAVKKVLAGKTMAFAVDGPRGPIYQVKEGICAISKKTNTPIIPLCASPKKAKIFEKSWNKAKLPMPFTKIEIHFGDFRVYSTQELQKELIALKDKSQGIENG